MPKRSSNKDIDNDEIELSSSTEIINQEEIDRAVAEGKNPYAVMLGRLGGLKGGKARAEKLSPEQRIDIAKKAAQVRWSKSKSNE
ncbi:hypothetical protein ACFLUP_03405 [Chloroflexota bacterium]